MAIQIDLNADIGELEGETGRALDRNILSVVTSCNIACGGHAGDLGSMRRTLEEALKCGVMIGAHPSYPDRENFGRQSGFRISNHDLANSVLSQISDLIAIAAELGTSVNHVKPHGAIYNDAARSPELSALICTATIEAGIGKLVGPPVSELQKQAERAGLIYIPEGFADRSYEPDGSLTPRSLPGSVHENPEDITRQAIRLAVHGEVLIRSGEAISVPARTLCLHGDTPGAASLAKAVRAALEAEGVELRAP